MSSNLHVKRKPLLTINNLCARIGRQVVLSNVSLDVNEGQCVAIVGGSGAGKSCLLRCVMGLHYPAKAYSGYITFLDQHDDFTKKSVSKKINIHNTQHISFVPQNPQAGLDPLKSLASQWQQALRCSGQSNMSDEAQQQLLESLKLKPFAKDYAHHWSQGMQQRLLIGFALLSKPKLLILDEPTSALDPLIASATMLMITQYAKQNQVAILIVTHDLTLASRFAERVAIMSEGRILEYGISEQILSAPTSDYGQLLVANRNWKRCS